LRSRDGASRTVLRLCLKRRSQALQAADLTGVGSPFGGWQANEPTSQSVGNAWLDSREGLLLPLPSALLPDSTNYLVNSSHPQASTHLTESKIRPFWFDKRCLR
jgi:RES domain-containing protein